MRFSILDSTIQVQALLASFYLYFCTLGGNISLSGSVKLNIDSDLNGPSPQFTLTCISTGGPATTVTWTRDSKTILGGNKTMLTSQLNAMYQSTLTVHGRKAGLYNCTVKNSKPSSASGSFTYVDLLVIFRFNFLSIVGLAPTNPKFIPHGNSTSILLIWTAPSPLGDTTGYRISFTAGDRTNGFMDINDTFTNNFTLTNIIKGVKYRMSIAGKSEHFCSNSVAFSGQLY